MPICENCMNQTDVEALIDNHDFDVNHHVHTFTPEPANPEGGPVTELVDYAAGGAVDQTREFWQPWYITEAVFNATTAADFATTRSITKPQLAYVAMADGSDDAWHLLRAPGGAWQWHQSA